MSRIVQKFGGTSLADVDRIKNVARRVRREVDAGNEVAVVVSAMAGVTNQLVDWTRQSSLVHDAREYDVVVSSGEQVTAGLLALALQGLGVDARSWLGWQIPLRTDGVHGKARIEQIAATSSRTSTVFTPAIPVSLRKPASSVELPTKRCWRWRRKAPRYWRRARLSWR